MASNVDTSRLRYRELFKMVDRAVILFSEGKAYPRWSDDFAKIAAHNLSCGNIANIKA